MNFEEQKFLDLINEYRYRAFILLEASVNLREESENYSSAAEKQTAMLQIAKLDREAVDLNLKADYLIFKLIINLDYEKTGF